ncbi:MAG TPA: C-GCAxxG-C-C family protein [Dehalococcoidales bacterium]|nr:C-GCAxxG-C-C family protein [Dehalococcoidales bacterium]
MDEIRSRMMQLAQMGYDCSQIIVIMGLDIKGKNVPDLVRAVGGLAGGCGEGSCTCGSLTGGCCLISLFTGKGEDREDRNLNQKAMLTELVRWFWYSYGFGYQGIDCMAIREANTPVSVDQRCWAIMESVYLKAMEILTAHGIKAVSEEYYAS